MPHRNFYIDWLSRSVREAFRSVGFESRTEMIRGVVLWALAVLLLWTVNWQHLPIIGTADPDVSGEVRLGLSAVLAIMVVFLGSLIWQLAIQPVRMYREAHDRANEAQRRLADIVADEADRLFLSAAYQEGFEIYRADFDPKDAEQFSSWLKRVEEWRRKVRTHIEQRWSIAALHDFDDPSSFSGWHYRRDGSDEIEAKDRAILTKFSSHLKNLDQLVRYGQRKHLGGLRELMRPEESCLEDH
jgi:hypothetical protein